MTWKKAASVLLCAALAIPAVSVPARAEEIVDYEPIPVVNGGFEQSNDSLPGWTVVPAMPSAGLEAAVSQDQAFAGTNSVKIVDNSPKSLEVSSGLIPVTAGKTYRLTAKVYVTGKSIRGYLRFKKGGSGTDLSGGLNTQLISILSANNGWQTLTIEAKAPEGAEFAQASFYMGAAGTGTSAYVDEVRLELKTVAVVNPLELPFDPPVVVGDAVRTALSQSAAYGVGPDGRVEQYVTTVGTPVAFHTVDAVTGELLFSEPLPGSDTIWGLTPASDGNVYFSTNGELYRYAVAERRIEALGQNPSNKQVFDLKASRDGKLYGATYSNTNMGRVFEYDIASGTFRDLGVMKAGQQYARGLGVTDDSVYVGIGTTAHLMRYDRRTGEVTEIDIPGVSGLSGTLSEVAVYGGKLLVYAGAKLHVLDERTHAFIRTIDFQSKVSPPSPHNPNWIYYKLQGELYRYDLAADAVIQVEGVPELPDDTAVKAHAWVTPTTGTFAGKTVLAGMAAFGESFLYDPIANVYEEHMANVPPSPATVNALEANGDYLYVGGYQRGMSVYDTKTGQFVHNNQSFHQPEGIGFLNGVAYFGTYSGARMYRLDMSKPLEYRELEWANPGLAADIGHEQDRPFAMTSGDGRLFIGTFPTYGQLGGALTILRETAAADGTGIAVEHETFRHLVPNQSVFGLAYRNGKVYGGTSRVGGLGVDPTEAEAKMFVFDTTAKRLAVQPFTPAIPRLTGPINVIGELSIGPDGLLWGIADGTVTKADGTVDHYDAALFAMNPDTLQIVKSKIIAQSPFNTSKYRPYYLRWGPDGLLYTTIGRKLFAVDPADLRAKQVVEGTVNLMTVGPDGSLYYVVGSKLHKIPVKIDRVVAGASNTSLHIGEASPLSAAVWLVNGKQAAWDGAAVRYTSSAPGVAAVENGELKAVSAGTAAIRAVVVMDGRTVESAPVEVRVYPDRFADVLYNPGGKLKGELKLDSPPTASPVTVEVHGPEGLLASQTVASSTYGSGTYAYAFSFKPSELDPKTVNTIQLKAYLNGELYSLSPWIRQTAPGNGHIPPGRE
ncbi:hypothetical protein [Paenibacillus flagellatus]|uniref:CBM-cenC domain-containing protein n=1 Tax=Paenibacillus flagellatus TaxID=2211139 RepID=A0A2V5KP23_9BACL|nr:hypothetical protein [Paenibacillus flagellatus]PYI52867.1 hypothetical protein DLM86_17815 [Paenibacillus flagellatus]